MIEKLKEIEETLAEKLKDPSIWDSLNIDYHPPHVERLWTQIDDEYRLSLHKIHPCKETESLLHPHAWESAIHVLDFKNHRLKRNLPINGQYEHGIGYHNENGDKIIISKQIFNGDTYYQMTEREGIHYVRPLDSPIYSVMLSSKVIWKDNDIKSNIPLSPLGDKVKKDLLNVFTRYYNFS